MEGGDFNNMIKNFFGFHFHICLNLKIKTFFIKRSTFVKIPSIKFALGCPWNIENKIETEVIIGNESQNIPIPFFDQNKAL